MELRLTMLLVAAPLLAGGEDGLIAAWHVKNVAVMAVLEVVASCSGSG